jgi:hypothetical protein
MKFVIRFMNEDNTPADKWVSADSTFDNGWFQQLHPEAQDTLTSGKPITLTSRNRQPMEIRVSK